MADRFTEKAHDVVYGIRWTDDKTLLERVAQALCEERRRTIQECASLTDYAQCDRLSEHIRALDDTGAEKE